MAQPGPFKDHYKTLGVSSDATNEEIRTRYRDLMSELHTDTGGNDKARLEEVREAYDGLGGQYGIGSEERVRMRREYDEVHQVHQRVEAEVGGTIRVPENDVGLLAGLTIAYRSQEPGVWDVRTSDKEDRDWMPEKMYQVKRDEHGRVHIFRTVTDWRYSDRRKDAIHPVKEGTLAVSDKTQSFKPDQRLGEVYLKGERGLMSVTIPPGYKEYLEAIKSLARKLTSEGKQDVQREVDILELNTRYGTINEGETRNSATLNDTRVRTIPLKEIHQTVRSAESRVTRFQRKAKEGQQASAPEGQPVVREAPVREKPIGSEAGENKG